MTQPLDTRKATELLKSIRETAYNGRAVTNGNIKLAIAELQVVALLFDITNPPEKGLRELTLRLVDKAERYWTTTDADFYILMEEFDMLIKSAETVGPAKEQSGLGESTSDASPVSPPTHEIAPQETQQAGQMNQTVMFSENEAVLAETAPSQTVNTVGVSSQSTAKYQGLTDFLGRPDVTLRATWGPGDKRGTNLIPAGAGLVPSFALPRMYLEKLSGFTSFRATLVVKVQVNPHPFQAGRLILAALPMPELIRSRGEWTAKHISNLMTVNHVQMDINKQTSVSLEVPFISPFNSFDLVHFEHQWAKMYCQVYSPLNGTEKQSLEVLFWTYFKDVELGTPTSAGHGVATEQGGLGNRDLSSAQVRNIKAKEQSGLQGLMGTGMDLAKSAIPGLGPAMDIGKSIGSLFGFSKPTNSSAATTVLSRPTVNFCNEDGEDNSHVLSLVKANAVDHLEGLGGTSCRETSFDFLKTIPQYVSQFSFSRNTKYGDTLWSSYVMPSYTLPGDVTLKATTKGTPSYPLDVQCPQPTLLSYIVSNFLYWTGSMVYTLRFVKTDFHSGRVEISYHPFADTVNTDRISYVFRTEVDLRTTSEISFTVPYVSPTPWKSTTILNPNDTFTWDQVGPHATGIIRVRALTPLMLSSAVAATCIEVLVEVRAGEDFRVHTPCRSMYTPVTLTSALTPPSFMRAREQSGPLGVAGTQETRTTAVGGFLPPSITGEASDIKREDTSMLCAGENFVDFQALTRRCAWSIAFRDKWKKNTVAFRPPIFAKPPYLTIAAHDMYPVAGGDITFTGAMLTFSHGVTPLNWVSAMFAFYRGGFRMKVASRSVKREQNSIVAARLRPARGDFETTFQLVSHSWGSPVAYESLSEKQIAEFQVPFYAPTILSCHWDYARVSPFDQSTVEVEMGMSEVPDDAWAYLSVSAADDFELSCFIGVPFVVREDFLDKQQFLEAKAYWVFNVKSLDIDPFLPVGPDRYKTQIEKTDRYVTVQDIQVTLRPMSECPAPAGGKHYQVFSSPTGVTPKKHH